MNYFNLNSDQQEFHGDMLLLAKNYAFDPFDNNFRLLNLLKKKWSIQKVKSLGDSTDSLFKKEIILWENYLVADDEVIQAFPKSDEASDEAYSRRNKALQSLTLTALKLEFDYK